MTIKLVKSRFGEVAHRVPTRDIALLSHKSNSIDKIMEENELAGQGH